MFIQPGIHRISTVYRSINIWYTLIYQLRYTICTVYYNAYMPKQQINIKLPPPLIDALRARATEEGITLTDLIQGFCEQGLGLPPSNTVLPDLEAVYERILSQLDKRILSQVDERIALQIAPLQGHINGRIDDRIASAIQKEFFA